jgi:hypothetical protein
MKQIRAIIGRILLGIFLAVCVLVDCAPDLRDHMESFIFYGPVVGTIEIAIPIVLAAVLIFLALRKKK